MKNAKILSLALFLLTFPALAHAAFSWNGGIVSRYRMFNYNDGLNSQDAAGKDRSKQRFRAWDYRANVLTKNNWDNWEAGFGIHTNNAIVNDFVTFNNNADSAVRIEYAYGKYTYKAEDFELAVTGGRQGTPVFFDKNSQHLYDTDIRWDGLSWHAKYKNFGLIAAQFIYGALNQGVLGASTYSRTDATDSVATTQSGMSYHFAFQPYAKFKLSDEIETMLAAGYYTWNNTNGSFTNRIHGGYNSTTLNASAETGTVTVDNPKLWHIYNTWTLPKGFRANAELVFNKAVYYTNTNIKPSTSSYCIGAGYGALKKAGDWSFDYFYEDKGLGSMPGKFTNGGITPDNKGHLFYAKYSPAQNMTLGIVSYFLKEKEKKTAAGVASNQEQKQTQWYFTAGINF